MPALSADANMQRLLHNAKHQLCIASIRDLRRKNGGANLGGVDKFEPVSGGGQMDHAEEAAGQLVITGGDGTVDLEVAEHALNAIALLVERPVMFDLHAAV